MANVTVKHILDIVAGILQDEATEEDDRHWTESELVDYYNLTTRRIVVLDPTTNAVIESVKLAEGSKHYIPSGGIAFVTLLKNMGLDGETPGEGINSCSLEAIQSFDRNWSNATAAQNILNVMPDRVNPAVFYTYPPSDGTGYVLEEYSKAPTEISWDEDGHWETALVGVADHAIDRLVNGILALAYKKDSDFPGSKERETDYETLFLKG